MFNTASITSACAAFDDFRGVPGEIDAGDRIVLGNTHNPGDGTVGTKLVWLLENAGTTIGNKTSDLKTTFNVTTLRQILFDQNR